MSTDPLREFGAATPEEIQRAHDLLHSIIAGECGLSLTLVSHVHLHVLHDTLCWVLNFPCGSTFTRVLNAAVEECRAKGVKVWQSHPPA